MRYAVRARVVISLAMLGLLGPLGCGGTTAVPGGRGGAAERGGTTGAAGTGGASGTTGAAGTGGASGTTGVAGCDGASGGTTGAARAVGTADSTRGEGADGGGGCRFTIKASLAPAIPTVGVVTFITNLTGLTRAQIDFHRSTCGVSGNTMTAPVDLSQPDHRTLLLGMKPASTYVFRIVATAGEVTCTSDDQTLVTGPLPDDSPKPTVAIMDPAAHARGFILTSFWGSSFVFIIDSDGDVVWVSKPPNGSWTRAHMGWDGRDIYGLTFGGSRRVSRISMDGTTVESGIAGLNDAHHDLTAIPGGIATLIETARGPGYANSVVERLTDGTLTTVVANLGNVYNVSQGIHPNSIHYHAWDDSYTIGDLNARLFVKVTRRGELVWQFGGIDPKDPTKTFQGVPSWYGNHGHHLLADGTFLFFNNPNRVQGFMLDTMTMTATSLFTHELRGWDSVLGDVQRLPNGNILVTFPYGKQIQEITASGQPVALYNVPSSNGASLGYAEFRDSLYGPPQY